MAKEPEAPAAEATEAEEDRVEEAPGLQINSRLSCQCEVKGDGPILAYREQYDRYFRFDDEPEPKSVAA